MKIMPMKTMSLLLSLALLPASALADDHCKFSRPQALDLDLSGAKAVVFEVNSHDLNLQAGPAAKAALSGRACASTQDLLSQLSLSQRKVGDKLVVTLERRSGLNINLGSSTYAWLDIRGTLPDTVMVQLKVGSGDVTARDIRGRATVAVGSGDIALERVGALHVVSLGSGDIQADGVRGDATVGSVGSGNLSVHDVQGAARIERIGSGDVELGDVRGTVSLGTLGSGDLDVRNAGGLNVQRTGSGSVRHAGVSGTIDLPRKR